MIVLRNYIAETMCGRVNKFTFQLQLASYKFNIPEGVVSLTRAQRSARFHVMLMVSPLWTMFCESCGGIVIASGWSSSTELLRKFCHGCLFRKVRSSGRSCQNARNRKSRAGPFEKDAHFEKLLRSKSRSISFHLSFLFRVISVLFTHPPHPGDKQRGFN